MNREHVTDVMSEYRTFQLLSQFAITQGVLQVYHYISAGWPAACYEEQLHRASDRGVCVVTVPSFLFYFICYTAGTTHNILFICSGI